MHSIDVIEDGSELDVEDVRSSERKVDVSQHQTLHILSQPQPLSTIYILRARTSFYAPIYASLSLVASLFLRLPLLAPPAATSPKMWA